MSVSPCADERRLFAGDRNFLTPYSHLRSYRTLLLSIAIPVGAACKDSENTVLNSLGCIGGPTVTSLIGFNYYSI